MAAIRFQMEAYRDHSPAYRCLCPRDRDRFRPQTCAPGNLRPPPPSRRRRPPRSLRRERRSASCWARCCAGLRISTRSASTTSPTSTDSSAVRCCATTGRPCWSRGATPPRSWTSSGCIMPRRPRSTRGYSRMLDGLPGRRRRESSSPGCDPRSHLPEPLDALVGRYYVRAGKNEESEE
jgi:hypothetical protein